jgi:hypothetical protein
MTNPPACPTHRELVDRALGPAPDDAVLERYAAEVPTCPECRRLLAIRVGAHPHRFDAPRPSLHGMPALAEALRAAPARPRWVPVAVGAAVLALAAAVALALRTPAPTPAAPTPAPAPVAVAPTPPAPSVVAPTPTLSPARPPRLPIARAVPRPPPPDDAVAEADDWPPPPFVDLRRGAAKGVDGSLRSVELVLSGPRQVGRSVGLTVVASTEAELAVCVAGPEQGVVWRGAVPAGRTALSRDGADQRFAFSAPGRYRFLVSGDAAGCSHPMHVVEVEVAP